MRYTRKSGSMILMHPEWYIGIQFENISKNGVQGHAVLPCHGFKALNCFIEGFSRLLWGAEVGNCGAKSGYGSVKMEGAFVRVESAQPYER